MFYAKVFKEFLFILLYLIMCIVFRIHPFLARLNKVHGELLYYPRHRRLALALASTNVKVLR